MENRFKHTRSILDIQDAIVGEIKDTKCKNPVDVVDRVGNDALECSIKIINVYFDSKRYSLFQLWIIKLFNI